jgi:tetratricopeptide (TPR) repeat protein
MRLGRIDSSKQFYQALLKTQDKNRYTLNALIDYSTLNEEPKESMGYVDEGIKKFPKLVNFYLRKSDLLIKEKKYKEVRPFLEKSEELNLEYNDHYRARFLQNSGILLAFMGNTKRATQFLTLSLKVEDSIELRMRLADLNTNDKKDETSNLIEESKAVKFLVVAKDFFEKRNYELALSNASKASDQYPGHIPSELFLAKVQMRLGLAQQSLNTLEALKNKYPESKDVNFALIEAYIDTYKFNDAKNRIATISTNEDIKNSYEFASVNAQLYITMGDPLHAISWLQNSISMNPLNDRDIYLLADLLIKRANFDAAKTLLNKCMELDNCKIGCM